MAGFDTTKLTGGRTCITFPSDTEGLTINIWAHHPTPEETAAAFRDAGLSLDEKGEVEYPSDNRFDVAPSMARAYVNLAELCIHDVENLDGWPSVARDSRPDGLDALVPAARALLPRVVLRKVGEQLWQDSHLGDEEGNDSGPPSTGPTSANSDAPATTAPSAPTPTN